jgi:hypothetical protein
MRCPGSGAVRIARPVCVVDRGTGLPADRRSVSEPVAVARTPSSSDACSRPSGGSLSVFGCLLDRERSESPTQSPFGSILRNRGSDSVPIRSLLSSSPCLGERDPRTGLGFLSGTHARRRELGRNRREPICAVHRHRRRGRPGGATLPPLRRAPVAVRFRIGPSPIQRRATAAERDALRGENAGSLRGVQARKSCATPVDAFRNGSG